MRPYRPSNGTEGMFFTEHYCDNCRHDEKYRETQNGGDGCQILARALSFNIGDPEYPKEWVQDEQAACCTAFQPTDQVDRFIREDMEAAGQMRLVP